MTEDARLERKALRIMAAIGCSELFAIFAALWRSSPARLDRVFTQGTVVGWAAGALTAAAFILVTSRRLPLIRSRLLDLSPIKFAGILFGLLAAVGEELWFRKIPMDWLARAGHGAAVQLITAVFLFGISHAIWGLFGRHWRSAVSAMIATGALGAALALVYLVGGRNIAPCIWAHGVINCVIEPWLLLAVLSRPLDARNPVIRSRPAEVGQLID